MVNIEHIGIDQETENAIEKCLTIAGNYGYGNFATAKKGDKEFIPSGNLLDFLGAVYAIICDTATMTEKGDEHIAIDYAKGRIEELYIKQKTHYEKNGKFIGFPANPEGRLSQHLMAGYDIIE